MLLFFTSFLFGLCYFVFASFISLFLGDFSVARLLLPQDFSCPPDFFNPQDFSCPPEFSNPQDFSCPPDFSNPQDFSCPPKFSNPQDFLCLPDFSNPQDFSCPPDFSNTQDFSCPSDFINPQDFSCPPDLSNPQVQFYLFLQPLKAKSKSKAKLQRQGPTQSSSPQSFLHCVSESLYVNNWSSFIPTVSSFHAFIPSQFLSSKVPRSLSREQV